MIDAVSKFVENLKVDKISPQQVHTIVTKMYRFDGLTTLELMFDDADSPKPFLGRLTVKNVCYPLTAEESEKIFQQIQET